MHKEKLYARLFVCFRPGRTILDHLKLAPCPPSLFHSPRLPLSPSLPPSLPLPPSPSLPPSLPLSEFKPVLCIRFPFIISTGGDLEVCAPLGSRALSAKGETEACAPAAPQFAASSNSQGSGSGTSDPKALENCMMESLGWGGRSQCRDRRLGSRCHVAGCAVTALRGPRPTLHLTSPPGPATTARI